MAANTELLSNPVKGLLMGTALGVVADVANVYTAVQSHETVVRAMSSREFWATLGAGLLTGLVFAAAYKLWESKHPRV